MHSCILVQTRSKPGSGGWTKNILKLYSSNIYLDADERLCLLTGIFQISFNISLPTTITCTDTWRRVSTPPSLCWPLADPWSVRRPTTVNTGFRMLKLVVRIRASFFNNIHSIRLVYKYGLFHFKSGILSITKNVQDKAVTTMRCISEWVLLLNYIIHICFRNWFYVMLLYHLMLLF